MVNIRWKIAQWFEKKWWNNYLKRKDSDKYLEWKKTYWKKFLNKISFTIFSNKTILDIGSGPAGIFILSNQDNSNFWHAIDPLIKDYELLDVFKKNNYKNVKFTDSDFENFNSKEKYDIIFCINAINHFKNINNNLKKIRSLLKKNGTIIISIDSHNYNFLKWLFYFIPFDLLHPHQYTDIEYEKIFEKNMLNLEKKQLLNKEFIFSYYIYILRPSTK